MTRRRSSLIALVVLLWTAVAWSADTLTLTEYAAAIERASTAPDGARVVVGHISRKLGIPVETLRTQRAQTELGWGDLLIAHRLAKATKLTFEQIAGESRDGKTWEEIAQAHNVDPANLTADLQQTQDAIEHRSEDKAPNRESLTGVGRPSTGRRY